MTINHKIDKCYTRMMCGILRCDLHPRNIYYNWLPQVNCSDCLSRRPIKVIQQMEATIINKVMSMMGKRGGLKGGPARAAALTPKRRIDIAKKAANARWSK